MRESPEFRDKKSPKKKKNGQGLKIELQKKASFKVNVQGGKDDNLEMEDEDFSESFSSEGD